VHDLVAIDETPRIFNKMTEQGKRLGAKRAVGAVGQKCTPIKIQNEAVEPVCRRCPSPHARPLGQKISEKFQRYFSQVSRQDTPECVLLLINDKAAKAGSLNGRVEMPERSTIATKSRQTDPTRPKLSLRWRFDPATGKPVARWVAESTEPVDTATVVLPAAA
jgi:hypothetical protein